jgi:hypothetical protein
MESVTAMDMVKDLGGSPTPISWGELYTALQQGVGTLENNSWPEVGTSFINRPTIGPGTNPIEAGYCSINTLI